MDVDVISLFEPECGVREIELVNAVLQSSQWGEGPMLESFERAFAGWTGRKHAVAVASGTLGTWITLRALANAPGRQRGVLSDTDRIGDRALALPLHTQLGKGQAQYIIKTLKDTATNVGAGAAIY